MASDSPNTPTRTHCFFITALSCASLVEPAITTGSRLSSTLYRHPYSERCLLFMSKEGAKAAGFTRGFNTRVHTQVQTGVHTGVHTEVDVRVGDQDRAGNVGKTDSRVDDYRLPITMLPENDVRSRTAPPSP